MAVQKAIATVLHKGERINVPYIYSSDNSPCAIKIPNVVRGRGNFTFQMTSWMGGRSVEISIGDQTVIETIPYRSSDQEGVKTVVHFVDAYAPDQALYIRFPSYPNIAITDLQLEVSTTDSDWRPAPEDEEEIARQAGAEGFDLVTATEVFNKLTNNGEYQGLYMQDGQLYVNATYIKSGIFSGASVDIGDGSFVVTEDGAVQMATTYTDDADPQPVYGYIRIDGKNSKRASIAGDRILLYQSDSSVSLNPETIYLDGLKNNNTRGGTISIDSDGYIPGENSVPSILMAAANGGSPYVSYLSAGQLLLGRKTSGGVTSYVGSVVTGTVKTNTLTTDEITSNGAELANKTMSSTSQSWSFSVKGYKSLLIVGFTYDGSTERWFSSTIPVSLFSRVSSLSWSIYTENGTIKLSMSKSGNNVTIRPAQNITFGRLALCYGYL